MFNNSLFDEEAKLKISEREQEAEAHRRHQQLGVGERVHQKHFVPIGQRHLDIEL